MKVSHLVQRYPVVSETFIVDQVRYLSGHIVSINKGDKELDSSVSSKSYTLIQASSSPKTDILLKRLVKRLFSVYVCPQLSPKDLSCLRTQLTTGGIDVVLAHFGCMGIIAGNALSAINIPLVVHLHGYDVSAQLKKRNYRRALTRTLRQAAGVVTVNSTQKLRVEKLLNGKSIPVTVIPCGVDIPTDIRSPQQKIRSWLFVGRLVEKKGPLEVLHAFAKTVKEFPDCTLEMIGDGPLWKKVHEVRKVLNLEDHVMLRGAQNASEVKLAYRRSDAYVQHSLSAANGDEEGWPVSIAEAASFGLPIVSTFHTSIPDQVPHCSCSLLVEEGDVDAMGESMLELTRNSDLAKRLGASARKRMAENYSRQDQLEKLRDFMKSCVKSYNQSHQ